MSKLEKLYSIIENLTAKEEDSFMEEEDVHGDPWESLQIGDRVTHKSFGRGGIQSLDDKYMIVEFKDRESKFLFPSAFEKGYLSCDGLNNPLLRCDGAAGDCGVMSIGDC